MTDLFFNNSSDTDWSDQSSNLLLDNTLDKLENVLLVGDEVFHQKFGYGIITELEADKALVDFEKADRKNIKTAFLTSEKDL